MCCVIPICGGFIFYYVVVKKKREEDIEKQQQRQQKKKQQPTTTTTTMTTLLLDTEGCDDGEKDYGARYSEDNLNNNNKSSNIEDDDDYDGDIIECCLPLPHALWPQEQSLAVHRRRSTYNAFVHFQDRK
jgi:hypothetical protein